MANRTVRILGLALLTLLPVSVAHAQGGSRTYLNQDIFIAQGQQVGNATCIFCSVQIEGEVRGNALVLFGNLNATGRIDGRTTVLGGNAVIDSLARLGGTVLVVVGNAVYVAIHNPGQSINLYIAIALFILGIPAYYFWRKRAVAAS